MNSRWFIFLLGLALTPLPYLSVLLDGDAVLLFRDLSNVQVPLKAEWIAAVHELWRVPFWDHLHLAGLPFLADPSYGPLYPLNAVLLPFSPSTAPRALLFFIVLHHVLLYLGGFWLARELRARSSVAFLGGLAFAWCGFAMSSDNLIHVLGSQIAIPPLFIWWRRALLRPDWGPELALAALALAWPIYAGDPQFVLMALGACALFAVRQRGALARLAALVLLFSLAAAPQLWPLLHHLRAGGARLVAVTIDSQTVWSLHPIRLLELVLPSPFVSTPDSRAIRGANFVNGPHGGGIPFFFSYYVGATLAVAALLYLAAKFVKPSRRRWPAFAFGISYLGVALLVTGSPLYALFFRFLPLWKGFRYPERLGYWLVFPLLAGGIYSLERLLRLRQARAWPLPALALAGAFGLALHWGNPALLAGGAVVTLLSFLLLRKPFHRREALLLALAATDLYFSAHRLVWPQSLALLNPAHLPLARELIAHSDADQGEQSRGGPRRVFSRFESRGIDPGQLAHAPLLALDTAEAWLFLRANTMAYFGQESVFGHGSLTPLREYLRNPCANSTCEIRTAQLLATRYVLQPNSEGLPKVERLAGALPYAFSPALEVRAPGARDAFLLARSSEFDYQHSVTVEGETHVIEPWRVESVEQSWDHVRVRVKREAAGAGLLVVNENFDPDWSAGKLTLKRVNGWALGVELPASESALAITLTYTDWSFVWGCAIFVTWALALCVLLINSRAARR